MMVVRLKGTVVPGANCKLRLPIEDRMDQPKKKRRKQKVRGRMTLEEGTTIAAQLVTNAREPALAKRQGGYPPIARLGLDASN